MPKGEEKLYREILMDNGMLDKRGVKMWKEDSVPYDKDHTYLSDTYIKPDLLWPASEVAYRMLASRGTINFESPKQLNDFIKITSAIAKGGNEIGHLSEESFPIGWPGTVKFPWGWRGVDIKTVDPDKPFADIAVKVTSEIQHGVPMLDVIYKHAQFAVFRCLKAAWLLQLRGLEITRPDLLRSAYTNAVLKGRRTALGVPLDGEVLLRAECHDELFPEWLRPIPEKVDPRAGPFLNDEWLPGDMGFVQNTNWDNLDEDLPGENIIYVGGSVETGEAFETGKAQFYGHYSRDTLKNLKGFRDWVRKWDGAEFLWKSRRRLDPRFLT